MTMNSLFETENNATATSARALTGTAELTHLSSHIASTIIRKMEDNIDDYRERITTTATDSRELDKLLDEFRPWADIEEDSLLRNLSEDVVEGMLKSQQSKRSRLKAKAMTLDNYTNLMTAAIAENLLRELYSKPKTAGGGVARRGSLDYTPAELEAYAADQEALGREIRNIQSKKSIMRSKADFDESSERWQQLLKAEQMLKDLRVGGTTVREVEVDYTKDKLTELLNGVEVEHLKAADSKDLLNAIMEMLDNE